MTPTATLNIDTEQLAEAAAEAQSVAAGLPPVPAPTTQEVLTSIQRAATLFFDALYAAMKAVDAQDRIAAGKQALALATSPKAIHQKDTTNASHYQPNPTVSC